MRWMKPALEGRTLEAWLLDAVLVGLVLLVTYLTVGILSGSSKDDATPRVVGSLSESPRLSVLNGCGVSGVALQFAEFLQTREFEVVEVGNHNSFDLRESVVVDRVGDLDAAVYVAAVLGISQSNVIQQLDRGYGVDASIVIGKDYDQLRPFRPEEREISFQ